MRVRVKWGPLYVPMNVDFSFPPCTSKLFMLLCIQIQFVGESAEDRGSPRREFRALLAHNVASSMFTGFGISPSPHP